MKSVHKEELYIKKDALSDDLFDEKSIFFDIETTGFSPSHCHIYLIGCARRQGNYICIDQFLAENKEDEKQILLSFLEILKLYDTIISYNGIGFDIPFLKAKCDHYQLKENFQKYDYLDVFKIVSKQKFLLKLDNYKQKSIEEFLGISRDDKYNGGELINVYQQYVTTKDKEAEDLLYLHNYEDVWGMMMLLPILSYNEILNGQYSIKESRLETFTAYSGEKSDELYITLMNDFAVPKRVSCKIKDFYIIMNDKTTTIRIPIFKGTLYYFFENYKDYFYLPKEDIAIHKSVATFVDKSYRERAKASNCYTKKEGSFLPQYEDIMNPEFRKEYKDKVRYFELTTDFISSDIMLRRYVNHIFKLCQGFSKQNELILENPISL